MKTYTRKINLGEVVELAGFLKGVLKVSGIDRVAISKVTTKLAKAFSEEQDAFNERLAGITKKLKPNESVAVPYTEYEKKKKDIKFTRAELSAVARAFVSIVADEKVGTIETVMGILRLSSKDCLMFEKYINDHFDESKMDFIDLKEDENLIPEE